MSHILFTRFMRVKKEWKSTLCWLFFPLIMSVLIMQCIGSWKEETKIPIALVVEEQTVMTAQLVEDMVSTDLLHIQFMNFEDAIHKLEQHELDSVFVIREGYEDNIFSNRRNHLIEAYSSNRSFAYQAVVETITSFAQQDAARSKAAFVIKQLFNDYGMEEEWSYQEIIDNSRERQKSEALIQSRFSYFEKVNNTAEQTIPLLKVWGVWTFFSIISTFFLFEWVLKENRQSMRQRWLFTRIPFKNYALGSLLLFTFVNSIIDIVTAIIFGLLYQEALTSRVLIALIAFRVTINLLAFLLATVFRQLFMYYLSGLAIALFLVVAGGGIIPLHGITSKWSWTEALSPVQSLLNGSIPLIWLSILAILLIVWNWKGGKNNA